MYNNTQSGVNVYLEIEFNKQGKEKLQEISRTYNSNAVSEDTTNTTTDNNNTSASTVASTEASTTTTEATTSAQ